jgi:hypothetical protein
MGMLYLIQLRYGLAALFRQFFNIGNTGEIETFAGSVLNL